MSYDILDEYGLHHIPALCGGPQFVRIIWDADIMNKRYPDKPLVDDNPYQWYFSEDEEENQNDLIFPMDEDINTNNNDNNKDMPISLIELCDNKYQDVDDLMKWLDNFSYKNTIKPIKNEEEKDKTPKKSSKT